MRIEVTIDGKTYKSKTTNEGTQAEVVNAMYENFDNLTKLKIDLDDGGVLIFGPDAMRKAQVVVYS